MAKKPQNLLLVTEHYPCSNQESFLETEIPYLARFFNVHVITRDTDKMMSRILPSGVTFSRPTPGSKLSRLWLRIGCRMSKAYRLERRQAQEERRWNHAAASHALDSLVESEVMRRYVLSLPLMQDDRPLVIYSANFNDYLYGLCRVKEMGPDIHVVARCHRANMFDPVTDERRETLNQITNERIDAVYFTSEERRKTYVHHFTDGTSGGKYRVAPLGVPGPDVLLEPPENDYLLRIVTCSPIEEDKRLPLLIEAMSAMKVGCLEWVHIGDGSQRDAVLELARQKLENKPGIRYEFLGNMNQEERYNYYASHSLDVFLSVSRSESVPSMMLEAMANHIFVCATGVDGVSDVVSNETGLLMPADPTVEQLTAFLEMLCSMDKGKFDARAQMGYQCWEQWYNAEVNCLQFASELSTVENIQPDEEPQERKRFVSWKPEEQKAADEAAEKEAAEKKAAEEAAQEAAQDKAPEQTENDEKAPADEPKEDAPAQPQESDALGSEAAAETPAEPKEPSEEKEEQPETEETAEENTEETSAQEEKPVEEAAEELLQLMEKLEP